MSSFTYRFQGLTILTNNSSFQNYSHPDDHTIRTTGDQSVGDSTPFLGSLSANTLQWSGIVLAMEHWICESENHTVTPLHNELTDSIYTVDTIPLSYNHF